MVKRTPAPMYYHQSEYKAVPYEQRFHVPQRAKHVDLPQGAELTKAVRTFVNQGHSKAAHAVQEHFNGKEDTRNQMAEAFRLAVDQTKRYLRGRERKYERWYDEKAPRPKVIQTRSDDDGGQDDDGGVAFKDNRHGSDPSVVWHGKRNWNPKPFLRQAGLKTAPNYYYGDGFGTKHPHPRKDIYPLTVKKEENNN